jgi:galactokinase/mevalonate kinase-like predicted kinase
LRISLGGGGTDLPSYYEKFGGFLIAAAIDRYVYITLHETFRFGFDREVFGAGTRAGRDEIKASRSSAKRSR